MSDAGSATSAALSIATAAICLGIGYAAQLFVKAEPFDGDPRPVTGTHNLYTVQELNKMTNKERVDAYYNKRADLHDVLQSTVGTSNVKAAYLKLQNNPELLLLKKAIEQYYPGDVPPPVTPGNFAQTNPMVGAVAVPLPSTARAPAPAPAGAVAVPLPSTSPDLAQTLAYTRSRGGSISESKEGDTKVTTAEDDNPQGKFRQTVIQAGGSHSDSDQNSPEADGSTDAPHLQFGGGVQPQGYSLGLERIGVGQ
jgi:hypothetical protein